MILKFERVILKMGVHALISGFTFVLFHKYIFWYLSGTVLTAFLSFSNNENDTKNSSHLAVAVF
jgi:hypothetical protein